MGCLGRGTWTLHLISVQTSQKGIKCTKAKEKGWQLLGKFHSPENQGIEEWQFNIPWGSRKIKSIPRGPWGILRNEIFFNLHAYYI